MSLADVHQLVTVLAATGEKSKTAFYVAGGALAAWAVIVSLVGINRPDFPGNVMRSRAVMGTSAALVAVAIATAAITASKPPKEAQAQAKAESAPAGGGLALAADPSGQLKFDRKTLEARAGAVRLRFTNDSTVPHDVTLALNGGKVAATPTIAQSKATLSANLKPGTYTFYCAVDSHRQLGMRGTLTVR
jgi:plastocyanin